MINSSTKVNRSHLDILKSFSCSEETLSVILDREAESKSNDECFSINILHTIEKINRDFPEVTISLTFNEDGFPKIKLTSKQQTQEWYPYEADLRSIATAIDVVERTLCVVFNREFTL